MGLNFIKWKGLFMKTKNLVINLIWNKGRITFNSKLFNLVGGEKASILFIKDGRKYYISPNGGDDGFKFINNKYIHRFSCVNFVMELDDCISYIVSEKPIMKGGYTCYEITNKTTC